MSDLREKAENATPGEWFWDTANSVCSLRAKQDGGRIVNDIAYGGTRPSTVNIQNANAAYIAAAHPQAIIALLDQRDAQAARIEELEGALKEVADLTEQDEGGNWLIERKVHEVARQALGDRNDG